MRVPEQAERTARKVLATARVGQDYYRLVEGEPADGVVGWWLEREVKDHVGCRQWLEVDRVPVGLDASTAQTVQVRSELLRLAWQLQHDNRPLYSPEVAVQVDGFRLVVVPPAARGSQPFRLVLESRSRDAMGDETWVTVQEVATGDPLLELEGPTAYLLRGWVRIQASQPPRKSALPAQSAWVPGSEFGPDEEPGEL